MPAYTEHRPKILVIGSINMDMVARIEHIPQPGETVLGLGYSFAPGGKGANAAVAAARLKAQVSFAGCVGDDDYGRSLRQNLQSEGVDDRLLRTAADAPTGYAPILVQPSGENSIIVFAGANRSIRPEDVPAMFREPVDAVMLQLEIPQEIVLLAGREAEARGIPVILDAGPACSFPLEQMRGLAIVSPNETETQALTGLPVQSEAEARRAAEALRARSGGADVVLKMGSRGAYLLTATESRLVPAFPVRAVDTTAAGDTFTAAMTVAYLRGLPLSEAVRYGCAAGALATTRLGAQPSLPTAEEVEAFLAGQEGA